MKKCLYCGNELPKEKEKYCSKECGQKHWYEKNYIPRVLYENKCLFCGKEFKTKREAKYCSNSCREKHKRGLEKKYCINCNKEIDITRKKFCDDDCRKEYYISNPKYTKKCVWCGKEFKTNENQVRTCSRECAEQYREDRSLKQRESDFKRKFETKYPNFKYISGYVNDRSMILCKCNECGEVQEKIAQLARPSYTRELSCSRCVEINKIKRSLINILMRRHNDLIREQDRITREKELEKLRGEKQERLRGKKCVECGELYDAVNVIQKHCSIECSNKSINRKKELIKRKKIKENGKIDWDISLTKLIKRDKNICHICGGKCNKEDYIKNEQGHFIAGKDYPSIDHVIPVSRGGTHTWNNVKLAHHYCNSIKSDNEVYEDKEGQLKMSI